jgi:hypothetical protein
MKEIGGLDPGEEPIRDTLENAATPAHYSPHLAGDLRWIKGKDGLRLWARVLTSGSGNHLEDFKKEGTRGLKAADGRGLLRLIQYECVLVWRSGAGVGQ